MEPPEYCDCSGVAVVFEDAQKIIFRWDSTTSEEARERMIFEGDREEVDRYLKAVDELQKSISSTSIVADDDDQDKVNSSTIQIAMARLEDEFRNILLNHTTPVELDLLVAAADPGASVHSSAGGDYEEEDQVADDDIQDPIRRAYSTASNSSTSYRSTSSSAGGGFRSRINRETDEIFIFF